MVVFSFQSYPPYPLGYILRVVSVFIICLLLTLVLDDPRVFELMRLWGTYAERRWPIGVRWFATYLIFLGTSCGTKSTYNSAINAFNTIFDLLFIPSPFVDRKEYPPGQVDIFMALATMASYKAADTCRGAKSAAEDA